MTAEEEFPLPGESGFKYKDNLEALGAVWTAVQQDAQAVDDTATPIRGTAGAIESGNYGLSADASTRVINHVSGRVTTAATRLRWFQRPITDYLAVLDAVRTPINTLREKWREGERDLQRLRNGEAIYVTDELVSYAEKWAGRQTELRTAYTTIITETVDPGKNTFVAGLRAIAENREPAATQPISLPQLPDFATLPGIYPRTGQPPPPVDPEPDTGDDGGGRNGNGTGSGNGDPDPDTDPEPQPEPEPEPPEPEPEDPATGEILAGWFDEHPTDGAPIVAAWLLLPVGAATYAKWAESPAGRTSLATWLARPKQKPVFDAFVQAPEAKENLTAWIREHGGLDEGEALPADPVAWINDPAHAAQRSQWLADPATREVIAEWVPDPANIVHRTAWLADAKTQTSLVGWLSDPAGPTNGQDFAEWTKNPTPIEPLTPTPPETTDPTGTGDPSEATDPTGGDDPPPATADDPGPVPTPA